MVNKVQVGYIRCFGPDRARYLIYIEIQIKPTLALML